MAGVEAGTQITASFAYSLLKAFGIGRNTVYDVMKMVIESCGAVFKTCDFDDAKRSDSPSPRTPLQSLANAGKAFTDKTKQCLFGRVAKPGKIRGRPEQVVVMPAIEELFVLLDVKPSFSDRLEVEDLASPSKYRAALHTALIKRVPGQYPRRWQAARLGVSKDTCRRYERRAGICVQPAYVDWSLGWHNVDQIIPDEAPVGQFIQDEWGRRFPPILDLARGLMAKGRRLIYRQQDANHYSVPEVRNLHADKVLPTHIENNNVAIGNISKLTFPFPSPPDIHFPAEQNTGEIHPSATHFDITESPNHVDEISISMDARSPDCAERLYLHFSQANPQRALTHKRARQLVEEYGEALVENGLRLVRMRKDLHNPAGFLIRWLQGRATRMADTVKTREGVDDEQQHAAWLKALQQSPYAEYLMNADQVVGI